MSSVLRTCVGCGTVQEKDKMLRMVRDAEGHVVPDVKGVLEGRGAYICKCSECFDKAVKKRSFARAYKCSVTADDLKKVSEFFMGE